MSVPTHQFTEGHGAAAHPARAGTSGA
jgi:hypothetical protein